MMWPGRSTSVAVDRGKTSLWPMFVSLLLVLALLPSHLSGALVYDQYNETILGHSRDTDGTFYFADLPPDSDAPGNVTKEEMAVVFEGFYMFAKAVVDNIQTQSFPYDLLRRVMSNKHTENEVINYQTNIIITCVVVACITLGIIILIIVYTVKHWRQRKINRFALKKQLFDQKRGRILIIIGFWLGIANMAFLMVSLVESTNTNAGMNDLDTDITGAMDGVSGYFNSSGEQWDFMSNDTNIWSLLTVLQSDVTDIGNLIWQPAVQGYSATLNSPFTATANLDSELSQAVSYLTDMQNQINSIVSGNTGDLSPVMAEIYYNLSFARNDFTCFGCDGSCAGCSNIVVDDIYYNMDFTRPEYYFWRGIADYIENQTNVTYGMEGLNASLDSYFTSISGSTNAIQTPSEADLKFDTLRSDWKTWYDSAKGQDSARYAFHMIFAIANVVMLMVLYFAWALLVLLGLFKIKPTDDNFKLPRRIILICLIVSLGTSIGYLALAIAGFYGAANTEKVVCQPARAEEIINETLDYNNGIPGHTGHYMASIMLGNGSLYPLFAEGILGSCRSNNTTSYSTFRQDLIVPDIYADLTYTQHFGNMSLYFDAMYTTLDNVTLIPPLLEQWLSNFTTAAFFNLTEYSDFLASDCINANLTTYINNLLTVYGHAYPNGPVEPAKTRLYEVSQSLLNEEPALTSMTTLKENVRAVFNPYSTLINSMSTNVTNAINFLRTQEPDLQSRSADYITSGVNQHRVTFENQLYTVQNQSQTWVTEVGPCMSLANAYDMAVNGFCNKYSDNANATWILVGHAVFFLLLLSLTTFLLYREIPQVADDEMEDDLDIIDADYLLQASSPSQKRSFQNCLDTAGCCCCFKSRKPSSMYATAGSRAASAKTTSKGRRASSAAVGVAPLRHAL